MGAGSLRTDRERDGVPGGRPDLRAPGVDYPTFVHARLREMVLAGGDVTELCEEVLAQASRVAAALDIGMGDGLAALTVGSRLDELSFSNLGDYAENILGMDRRTAQAAAREAWASTSSQSSVMSPPARTISRSRAWTKVG